MTQAPPETKFWQRPDIQAAQRALDVWGTTTKHWRLGGQGIPILDWIDMRDERFVILEKHGRRWVEEGKNPAFEHFGKLSRAFLLVLGVEAIFGEFANPPVLHGLMAHRYPQDGPLAHDEAARGYRKFWTDPRSVVGRTWAQKTFGMMQGRFVAVRADQLLAQMERDFLEHVAHCGVKR